MSTIWLRRKIEGKENKKESHFTLFGWGDILKEKKVGGE